MRDVLTDGAEAQDAEGLAGERLRDVMRPSFLLLILDGRGVRFGDVEQRPDDVLRHRFAVSATRASERQRCGQIGQSHPALHAGGHGLDPAQLGHRREHPRRNGGGHQRLRPGQLLGGEFFRARHGLDQNALRQAGGFDRIEIGGGRVGPE